MSDRIEQLRTALRSGRRASALELLADPTNRDVRTELLTELVDLSATHNAAVYRAQEVVGSIERDVLTRELWPVIEQRLQDADSEPFRLLAQLLDDLGMRSQLARLVAIARQSNDADIREVADDYGTPRPTTP